MPSGSKRRLVGSFKYPMRPNGNQNEKVSSQLPRLGAVIQAVEPASTDEICSLARGSQGR